jgi:RecA-family ATPase
LEEIAGLFPRGYLSFVVARAGTGKTWFVQRIVSDLSVGGPILDGFVHSEPRKSIIFAGEAGYETLIRRGTALRWPVVKENINVFDEAEMDEAGFPLDLDTLEGKRRIESLIENLKPDILFFDSLMSFHTSDENSSKEMKPIYSYLRKLSKKNNVAIVACHHVRKRKIAERKSRMDQDEVIGSSVLNRYASLIIGLEEIEIQGAEEGEKAVYVSAQKTWRKKPRPFTFQITENAMKINFAPLMGRTKRDQVWNFIETTYKLGEEFSTEDIKNGTNAGASYVRNCLKDWVESGKLIRKGTTNSVRYAIAEVK